jgi:hypothetical protein
MKANRFLRRLFQYFVTSILAILFWTLFPGATPDGEAWFGWPLTRLLPIWLPSDAAPIAAIGILGGALVLAYVVGWFKETLTCILGIASGELFYEFMYEFFENLELWGRPVTKSLPARSLVQISFVAICVIVLCAVFVHSDFKERRRARSSNEEYDKSNE